MNIPTVPAVVLRKLLIKIGNIYQITDFCPRQATFRVSFHRIIYFATFDVSDGLRSFIVDPICGVAFAVSKGIFRKYYILLWECGNFRLVMTSRQCHCCLIKIYHFRTDNPGIYVSYARISSISELNCVMCIRI